MFYLVHQSLKKDIQKLLTGQTLAQFILVASLPVFSYFYNPESFGIFATLTAISWVLSYLFSLKADSFIILSNNEIHAKELLIASFFTLILGAIFTSFIVLIFFSEVFFSIINYENNLIFLLFALNIISNGATQTFKNYSTYLGQFSSHNYAAISQSLALVFSGLSLGYIMKDSNDLAIGLILSLIISNTVSVMVYSKFNKAFKGLSIKTLFNGFKIMKDSFKLMKELTIIKVLFSISESLPPIIFSSIQSSLAAGFFAMSERLVSRPTSIFSQSFSHVIKRNFKNINNLQTKKDFIKTTLIKVSILTIVLYGFAYFSIGLFMDLTLSEEWIGITPYIQLVILMESFNFIYFSFEDILIIQKRLKQRVWGQFLQTFLLVIVFIYSYKTLETNEALNLLAIIISLRVLFVINDLRSLIKEFYEF